jgi:hypothetical protein
MDGVEEMLVISISLLPNIISASLTFHETNAVILITINGKNL